MSGSRGVTRSWWIRGGRLDAASASGFGYSGLVDLGARGGESGRLVGVVFEPGHGGVAFQAVPIDLSDLLP